MHISHLLDWIASIAESLELDTFDDTTITHIQTLKHGMKL